MKKSYTSSINEIVKQINQSKDDTALKGLFDFIDANKEVIEVKKYKENLTGQDRIFEAKWRKTLKYSYFGLTRNQMMQIEKYGYIMPEEIHE